MMERAGAVAAGGTDAGVAAHYGNPVAEQRALASGAAVVDLSHHTVVAVSGPDRLTWLDSMTSQRLANLAPGESAEALLLGQTGRVEHVLRIVDDGVTAWLLLDQGEAPELARWLESMKFMLRVDVVDRSADYVTFGTLGAPSVLPASPNGVPIVWDDPWPAVAAGGYQYARHDGHPGAAWTYREFLVESYRSNEFAELPVAGTLALEALRIAAWRPTKSTEVDERTIPHEVDWLRSAVHLSKGCYRGQETVAKVHNLGHPPRRLVMLHLDGSEAVLPERGAGVFLDDEEVGRITSVGRHHEFGPIALALVKRRVDPDAVLTVPVGGVTITAAQELIVPPNAGAVANVPRLPRLGSASR